MTIEAVDFDFIRSLMQRHTGIYLEDGKEYLVESRLGPLAEHKGLASVGELIAALRRHGDDETLAQLIDAMVIGETLFLRDNSPFRSLRDEILPETLSRRAAAGQPVHIWSAATSTGQEAYSIAMVLEEMVRRGAPTESAPSIRIFASDISAASLTRAKEGVYTQQEVNRGLPATLLMRYFQRDGLRWRVDDALRRQVKFLQINLAHRWPPLPEMDIILLRNVLIYFDTETKREVLRRTRRLMGPESYLLVGAAEMLAYLDQELEAVRCGQVIWYRLRKRD